VGTKPMSDQILFDRLAYIDRLKRTRFDDDQARALADAMTEALRESVATKRDIIALRTEITRLENKIELAVRDLTIRMGAMLVVLGGFLASIKFFG
jgi:hypothetical protein